MRVEVATLHPWRARAWSTLYTRLLEVGDVGTSHESTPRFRVAPVKGRQIHMLPACVVLPSNILQWSCSPVTGMADLLMVAEHTGK